jgi:large subunit ribosomal protein L17
MNHRNGRKKLNMKPSHKRSVLRNQVITLIMYGHVVSTKARVQEVRKLAERLVTIAREGKSFNGYRQALSLLPYQESALNRLFEEIAPRYVERNGGYTRVISLGQRISDTATVARLEWV